MNLAAVVGTLSSPPEVRTLASGTVLAQLQITTRAEGEAARSVPVAVTDPPAWVEDLEPGEEVAVLGTVHRRFFRAGGTTASRVEVVADRVVRARDRRGRARLAKTLHERAGTLDG
jgi:single-strand DNA-binding protein